MTVDRRSFLKAAGAASTWPGVESAQRTGPVVGDRDAWIAIMRRLADPVLTHLANGTLKARMPVEQAAFSENNVRYQASLMFINSKIAELQFVIAGQ